MSEIIDGNAVAALMREEIKRQVDEIREKHGEAPTLAVVLVGDDPASGVYVRMKGRDCEATGIRPVQHTLDASIPENELLDLVDRLNADPDINGILVQLPLPGHIREDLVIERIDPARDVDGFHPINMGRLVIGDSRCFRPCTPAGCQELIHRYEPDLKGKHVVVVGRSNIVGKPMANMMYQKNDQANCTVTICHTGTKEMGYFTRQADILVVAAGRPGLVTADMVREDAIVIDVGMNRVDDPATEKGYRLVGDVDFEKVREKVRAITPVPGGVGPLTRTMLLKNTLHAWYLQKGVDVC